MGNNEQKSVDAALHELLENRSKEIDQLKVERDTLQKIILEELQNPQSMPTIHQTFQRTYSITKNSLKEKYNKSLNNENYFEKYQANIINILFALDMQKINVVTPDDFKLQNVYSIVLEKYPDKESFCDINSLYFEYNGKDISNHFINNDDVSSLNLHDKSVITIIKKNNLILA